MDHVASENRRNLQDSKNEAGESVDAFIDQLKDHSSTFARRDLTPPIIIQNCLKNRLQFRTFMIFSRLKFFA